jgi:hypothetical protein
VHQLRGLAFVLGSGQELVDRRLAEDQVGSRRRHAAEVACLDPDRDLLTRGTLTEVLAAAKLTTWSVAGPDLRALAATLRGRDGVEQVVAFGNTLHVSSRDAARLAAVIATVRDPRHEWKQITSGLEDVFISLMDEATDNFA